MEITTINPATEEILQHYQIMNDATVSTIVKKTHTAFLSWHRLDFAARAKPMRKIANLLRDEKKEHAFIISQEMGKPIKQAMAEIEKCALTCEHYAEQAENYLKPRQINTEMQKTYVSYQPLGVVLAIMPWNFPYWQVFRCAAPTLMAGNGIILKHAANSSGAALLMKTLFKQAGFPENIFTTLIVEKEKLLTLLWIKI